MKSGRAHAAPRIKPSTDVLKHLTRLLENGSRRYRRMLKKSRHSSSNTIVHRFRVETRRLASTLESLAAFLGRKKTQPALAKLKRHLDAFDDLRDVQVQIALVSQCIPECPPANLFARYLSRREKRLAKQTRKKIRDFKTRPLAECVEACSDELKVLGEQISRRTAATLMERTVDRAFLRVRRLRRAIDPSNSATIHKTRLAFKKFRYMVEALSPGLSAVTKTQLAAMRDLQAIMGDIQDCEILLASLARFEKKKNLKPQKVAGLRALLLEHRDRSVGRCMKSLPVLERFWRAQPDLAARHFRQ